MTKVKCIQTGPDGHPATHRVNALGGIDEGLIASVDLGKIFVCKFSTWIERPGLTLAALDPLGVGVAATSMGKKGKKAKHATAKKAAKKKAVKKPAKTAKKKTAKKKTAKKKATKKKTAKKKSAKKAPK